MSNKRRRDVPAAYHSVADVLLLRWFRCLRIGGTVELGTVAKAGVWLRPKQWQSCWWLTRLPCKRMQKLLIWALFAAICSCVRFEHTDYYDGGRPPEYARDGNDCPAKPTAWRKTRRAPLLIPNPLGHPINLNKGAPPAIPNPFEEIVKSRAETKRRRTYAGPMPGAVSPPVGSVLASSVVRTSTTAYRGSPPVVRTSGLRV